MVYSSRDQENAFGPGQSICLQKPGYLESLHSADDAICELEKDDGRNAGQRNVQKGPEFVCSVDGCGLVQYARNALQAGEENDHTRPKTPQCKKNDDPHGVIGGAKVDGL